MLKSMEDLIILEKNKILGEGAYSEVVRVFNKNDQKEYALKKVNLKDRYKITEKGRYGEFKQRDKNSSGHFTSKHNKIP